MKQYRGRLNLILAAVGLAIFFFTLPISRTGSISVLETLSGADSTAFLQTNEKQFRDSRSKRIKVGLDLQGGVHMVLEVNILKMFEAMAKNKDDQYNAIVAEIEKETQLSEENVTDVFKRKFEEKQIRLSRYYGSLRETNDDIIKMLRDESDKAVDRAIEIVRNRVDQYGDSEPSIQKQGGRQNHR